MTGFFHRVVQTLEKDRLSLMQIFLILFLVFAVRSFIEVCIFGYRSQLANYAHVISFYIACLLGITLILRILSRTDVKKILNAAVWVCWIVLLPPIVDKFIFHYELGYAYLQPQDMLFPLAKLSIGQIILVSIIFYLCVAYVFLKTGAYTRTILSGCYPYLFILTMSTQFIEARYLTQYSMFLYFLTVSIVLLTLLLYVDNKRFFAGLLRAIKTKIVAVSAGLVLIGASFGGGMSWLSNPLSADFARVFLSVIAIVLAWVYAAIINDVYDVQIDRVSRKGRPLPLGILSMKQLKTFAALSALASLLISIPLGIYHFAIVSGCLLLGTFYSAPPLRLRKKLLWAPCTIGAGAVLASLIGLVCVKTTFSFENVVGGILIFWAFSTASCAKDLSDYEGDKKAGARTVFTVFGLKRGTRVTQLLLFTAFLSPLILFHQLVDIVVFLPFATSMALLFGRFKKYNLVLLLYFIALIYCGCRLLGVII